MDNPWGNGPENDLQMVGLESENQGDTEVQKQQFKNKK